MKMKELLDRARGNSRPLSRRELVEREFGDFLAWLKAHGSDSPIFQFEKETWDLMLWQRFWNSFQTEQQTKAQADQRKQLAMEVLKAGDDAAQGAIFNAVVMWPKERRETLLALLAGPPAPEPIAPAETSDAIPAAEAD